MFPLSYHSPVRINPNTTSEYSLGTYLKTNFEQGFHDGAMGSIYRASDLWWRKQIGDRDVFDAIFDTKGPGRMLEPEVASDLYGMGGMLKFDKPIYESAAQLMMERKQGELRRNYLLQSGSKGVSRTVAGFGTQMVASMLNPVDAALMFVPIVGAGGKIAKASGVVEAGSKFSRLQKARRFLTQGLIQEETLAKYVSRPGLVGSAIEGTVGQAIAEVPLFIANTQDQLNYTWKDSLINVAAGGAFASVMRVTLEGVGRLVRMANQETRLRMKMQEVRDIMSGEEARHAGKYLDHDPEIQKARVKQQMADNIPMNYRQWRKQQLAGPRDLQQRARLYTGTDEVEADIVETVRGQRKMKKYSGRHGIIAAAIVDKDGNMVTGASIPRMIAESPALMEGKRGYVTTAGDFVTPEEAARLLGGKGKKKAINPDDLNFAGYNPLDHRARLKARGWDDAEIDAEIAMLDKMNARNNYILESEKEFIELLQAERQRRIEEFVKYEKENPHWRSPEEIEARRQQDARARELKEAIDRNKIFRNRDEFEARSSDVSMDSLAKVLKNTEADTQDLVMELSRPQQDRIISMAGMDLEEALLELRTEQDIGALIAASRSTSMQLEAAIQAGDKSANALADRLGWLTDTKTLALEKARDRKFVSSRFSDAEAEDYLLNFAGMSDSDVRYIRGLTRDVSELVNQATGCLTRNG